MSQDGWMWQGRQEHGWFGHGTKPRSGPAGGGNGRGHAYGTAPATLDERIRALGYAAIAGLPASKRHHPAASFDGSALERLVGAMRVWVGGLGLDHATFAARYFDRPPSSPVVGHLRRATEIVAGATTSAEMRAATDALVDGMLAVGLDGWPRVLRDAYERAMAAGPAAPLVRPVRDGSSAAGAAAGFLAPAARSGLLARVLGAALRLAGPEVAAVGVLLAAGVFRHPEHVRFTAPRVAGRPDARAVMDWRTNRIAVAVPGPRGGEPRVALFGMRFVVREGHPTYQVLDAQGQVVGRLSQDGEVFFLPAGERELARAQAAAPETRPGSGIETRDDDERALVAAMLAQGKSTQEIQAALDARRNGPGGGRPGHTTGQASGRSIGILPNADVAVIDLRKLSGYSLNPNHPEGGHKARVFAAALGFTQEHSEQLSE